MKTETTLTRAEHIIENALTNISNIYGLPADDYLTIYGHLVKCIAHIRLRQEGRLPEHTYLPDEQPALELHI